MGRFINADTYVSTGQGVLGNNMFAYCLNNIVNYLDSSGCAPRNALSLVQNKAIKATTRSLPASVSPTTNSTVNGRPTIDDFRNPDGSYSLYDNKRHNPDSIFHEQILSGSLELGMDTDAVLGGGASITLITGSWEWENFELGLLNFGKAEAYVGKGKGFKGVGAIASIWSPEVTFTIFDVEFTLGADIGAIGAEIDLSNGFKAGYAYGIGFSFSVTPK